MRNSSSGTVEFSEEEVAIGVDELGISSHVKLINWAPSDSIAAEMKKNLVLSALPEFRSAARRLHPDSNGGDAAKTRRFMIAKAMLDAIKAWEPRALGDGAPWMACRQDGPFKFRWDVAGKASDRPPSRTRAEQDRAKERLQKSIHQVKLAAAAQFLKAKVVFDRIPMSRDFVDADGVAWRVTVVRL